MMARSRGGQHWLENAQCEVNAISIGGSSQPVTLQDPCRERQSYVLSPRSAWIDYAKDEAIRHVAPELAWLTNVASSCALSPISLLLHASGLDRAAIVCNRLMSTNLYPDWGLSEISAMSEEMAETYADRPLVMRNISREVNPGLADSLTTTGWNLVPARIVYLCDPQRPSVWKHNHIKQDAKLLGDNAFEVIRPDQIVSDDLPWLRSMFRQIFLTKHSDLNPDFTPEFFSLCQENGFLDLYGLRSQGKMVGVLGLYEPAESAWLTTPLIGYDTSLPQDKGVYRALMALLLQQARARKTHLHYSSGAGQFKRARAGSPSLEYTAIFSKHLSRVQRQANQLFAHAMQNIAPGILRSAEGLTSLDLQRVPSIT